jgi:hypothetical protein
MIDNLKEYSDFSEIELLREFENACLDGNLILINQLLTVYNVSKAKKFTEYQNHGIDLICSNNHLDILKSLLTIPELKEHLDLSSFYEKLDSFLFIACGNKSYEVMKYLLTSSDLEKQANLNTHSHYVINQLCIFGDLEMIKYVLSSPELTKHADIHANSDTPFKTIISKERLDIMEFLIFEMNIEKTESIKEFLSPGMPFHKKVDGLFNVRELEKELSKNNVKAGKPIKI